jgi:predicted chitinase
MEENLVPGEELTPAPKPKKKRTAPKKTVVAVETSSEFNEMSLVESLMEEWGCDTDLKKSLFFFGCDEESNGRTITEEDLNYTSRELKEKFTKWFPLYLSGSYGGNPEKIGNRIYERKLGNGPESSGDGYKFRGRGYLKMRGRNYYEKLSQFVEEDLLETPDLVSSKYPLLSSLFVFCQEKRWEK